MATRKTRMTTNGTDELMLGSLPEDVMEELGNVEMPPYSDTPLAAEVFNELEAGGAVPLDTLRAVAHQVHRRGYKKLAVRLRSIADDPPAELLVVADEPDEDRETIKMSLTDGELDGLGWIANRYESGRILYGAYNDEDGTFDLDEVVDAYRATAGDGGNVGVVPNAGGSLAEKINQLFEKSGAYDLDLEDE
jgi:hypothetical protein